MVGRKRRRFDRAFKVEAVRAALRGDRPQLEVARELGLHKETLYRWIHEFREDASQSFPGNGRVKDRDRELEQLRREVHRLETENAFLKKVSAYFAKSPR